MRAIAGRGGRARQGGRGEVDRSGVEGESLLVQREEVELRAS